MKKIVLIIVLMFCAFSCSEEPITSEESTAARPAASTSQWGDYNIALSVTENGSLWTYTITRTRNNAKDLSHFILALNNCGLDSATFGNIVWATVNGSPANLSQSEGSGTNCNPQAVTTNFVKFDNLTSATSWVLVIKFDRGYEIDPNGVGWIKAGNSCNQGAVPAPGCPIEEYCSFSQGFFFANGATNNGSSFYWSSSLTIGGISYTQQQGNTAWNIDRGRGGDQTLNGFFQLGAVRLSEVESEVAQHATIIDTYFNGLDIFSTLITTTGANPYSYFNLPATSNGVTKAQVIAAGGAIGSYVDENHCQ